MIDDPTGGARIEPAIRGGLADDPMARAKIDCSVGFGRWPFARFSEDTPARLDRLLAGNGIQAALVSSIEAILYEEPEEWNRDLARRLRGYPRLLPIPVANPRVRSVASIVAEPGLKAVKLIPNYHGYSLGDDRTVELCEALADRGVPVLVQMRVEDERSHYELLKVPGVPVPDIVTLTRALPNLAVVALGPYFAEAIPLAQAGVYVDISFAETLDTLGQLCKKAPVERILFGSHAPWMYPRAASAKLARSTITEEQREAIGWGTASRLFGITTSGC